MMKKTTLDLERWADWLLLVGAFFLLFCGLGGRSLWGSEGRWAEVVREMLLTKDYFHPTIGGLPYFDKPLLTYWLIVMVAKVSGTLNEWVLRVPSALAGVAAVWATMNIGKRLWSPRVGWIAGWILLTTYGLLMWSRTAEADAENLAAVMLCVSWYWLRRDKPVFITFVVFYLIAFLGALTKGLAPVAVSILAVLPDLVREKRWHALFRPSHFLALAVGLIVYAAPFIYSSLANVHGYQTSGLELVFRENIQRFIAPFDHKEPFYVYFYHIPTLFLPWSILLILALIALVPRWKQLDDKTRWLMQAAVLIFLFFTASGSRRNYYILPIIPFCALMTAVFLAHLRDARVAPLRKLGLNIQQGLMGLVIALELATPAIFKIIEMKKGIAPPPGFYFVSITVGIVALAVWILIHYMPRWFPTSTQIDTRLVAAIAVTSVLLGGIFCRQINTFEFYRAPERAFYTQLKGLTANVAPQQIGFFASDNRSSAEMFFYLDKPGLSTVVKDGKELRDFLQGPTPRVLIAKNKNIPQGIKSQLIKFPIVMEGILKWEGEKEQGKKRTAWLITEPVMADIEIGTGKGKTDAAYEE